ncbi:MAG: DinB family protein [Chloroflexi bacterium]|nr:DinB family protein [Chloroflexota bacterium]
MSDHRSITEAVIRQFERQWKMMQEAIENCPDEEWYKGCTHFMVPARLAFHAIQAADFHLSVAPARYDWGRFGFDWEECEPTALPSRVDTLAFLDEVRAKIASKLDELEDRDLAGPDTPTGYFPTMADHLVYVLRHTQYHLGQLDAELHRRGLPSPQWQ